MKILQVKKKNINYQDFIRRVASEKDFSTLITEPCVIECEGKKIIFYGELPFCTDRLVQTLKSIPYQSSDRSKGLKTTSTIFGYSPRITFRNPYCTSTSLARKFPKEHKIICDTTKEVVRVYEKNNKKLFSLHQELTNKKILPDYQINGGPFTSGIINKDNQLNYHFDTGNIKEVNSFMLVFKQGIQGGYLSCPEYDIGFELKNNTYLMFDGQNILHGVTPIKKSYKESYRYSVVFYTLQQLWNCLPLTEELARIRNKKTQRELKRTSKNIEQTRKELLKT